MVFPSTRAPYGRASSSSRSRPKRSEEHTSELQSHRDLHSCPTRRSSDLSAEAARGIFDKEIDGFSIDSRAVRPGELFFALSPEDYRRHCFTATSFADAHRFIPQALGDGAVAAVARAASVEADEALRPFRGRLLA